MQKKCPKVLTIVHMTHGQGALLVNAQSVINMKIDGYISVPQMTITSDEPLELFVGFSKWQQMSTEDKYF
jgi:hypothetical protein